MKINIKNKKKHKKRCKKCNKIIKDIVPRLLCNECKMKYYSNYYSIENHNNMWFLNLEDNEIEDGENFFLFTTGFFDPFLENF